MKKRFVIDIEVKDNITVLPEEGKTEDDYTEKELTEFRLEFVEEIMSQLKNQLTDKSTFEETFIENLEEYYVEGYDSFDDYGITIKFEEVKQ